MIYAVDFDGTLCKNEFPKIGEPYACRIEAVKRLQKNNKIILWTCRTGKALTEAVIWCAEYGLQFDAVNENIQEVKEAWGEDTRKVFADHYIDDKNFCDSFLDLA